MKECPVCRRCFPDHVNHCPDDGDATTPSIAGEPILDGRYQLERRIGHGGMGVVYQARHIFLKTAHAIKVILPDLVGNDPMLVTRFRQEALAAAAIRHQNIIAVTDFGVVRATMPFLVMEFVSGKSLHDMLAEEGALPPARALEIISAVGAGVGAAHRQGIIHRDLKPLNIMFQEGLPIAEGLKVLDFGLAKIKSGELLGSFVQAKTSGLMGSPFYMAPEQWGDEEPDARADIYSLGVILFQMLSGDVPFKGTSIPSIMKKHLTQQPPTFASLGIQVPPQIEAVVRHALEKEAENRPGSVEDFTNELREAIATISASLNRTSLSTSTQSLGVATAPPSRGATSIPPDATTMRIRTRPARSRVYINNVSVGISDHDGLLVVPDMLRGTHSLRIMHDDYAEWERQVECTGGVCEVEATLDNLMETSIPPASVFGHQSFDPNAGTISGPLPGVPHQSQAAMEAQRLRQQAEALEEQARQEEALRRAEEERQRLALEQRAREEEEARRRREEEEERLKAEEQARLQAEAEALRLEEEARRKQEEEDRRRAAEEEEKRRAAETARLKAEEEERRRQEEEQRKQEEERKRQEEERLRLEEEARLRAEEERRRVIAEQEAARRQLEEEERRRAEEEHRLARAEAEKQRKAEEEARLRAEEERKEQERLAAEERAAEQQKEREEQAARIAATINPAPLSPSDLESTQGQRQGVITQQLDADSSAESERVSPAWQRRQTSPNVQPTAGRAAPHVPPVAPAPERKSGVSTMMIAAIVGVLLIGGGVGVWFMFGTRPETSENRQPPPTPATTPVGTSTPTTTPSPGTTPAPPIGERGEMVSIPGGRFRMGRDDGAAVEGPVRSGVSVGDFQIDKTEVTNAEYAAFVRETGHEPPSHWAGKQPAAGTEMLPVVNVSYDDAVKFASWRSKRDGAKYRLPTEEEWEYAARGGDQDNLYPWGNAWVVGRAGVKDSGATGPSPVGSYPEDRTRWGVLDMAGNVYEWTSSRASLYPGNEGQLDPTHRSWVIVRGGAYVTDYKQKSPTTYRDWFPPSRKEPVIGFRLVRVGPTANAASPLPSVSRLLSKLG